MTSKRQLLTLVLGLAAAAAGSATWAAAPGAESGPI